MFYLFFLFDRYVCVPAPGTCASANKEVMYILSSARNEPNNSYDFDTHKNGSIPELINRSGKEVVRVQYPKNHL